jgi:hypothetical protein
VNSLQTLPADLLDRISKARITTSFVVDDSGGFVNELGNSRGIGNQTDLELLRALRANAEVVLTSGLTARNESYRMPRHADLAIFTSAGVQGLDLKPRAGQKLQILSPPQVNSYQEALRALASRYQSIHIEFGPTGVLAISPEIGLFVISGRKRSGIDAFIKELDLVPGETFELPDLFVTLALGRG